MTRSRPAFEAALPSVQDIVLFRDAAGTLQGFVGNKLLDVVWQGRSHFIFFTAWSWMDREWVRHPFARFYWTIFSSTCKSYLLLPRTFVEYWPRRGAEWRPA